VTDHQFVEDLSNQNPKEENRIDSEL